MGLKPTVLLVEETWARSQLFYLWGKHGPEANCSTCGANMGHKPTVLLVEETWARSQLFYLLGQTWARSQLFYLLGQT